MYDLNNKKTIANNIKKYMNLNNKTRNDICNDLGFKYTTFTDWVNAKTYPRIDKIEMLANYFGIEKSDLVEREKSNEIVNRLENAIKNSNLSYAELEKRTNISKSALQRYASGKTKKIPLDVITSLAPVLDVTPQYLIGLENYNILTIEEVKTILKSDNETRKNLIDAIMKLPDEDIALLDTIVNRLNKKAD